MIALISEEPSIGSIHTIIHDDLKMRKVWSRWMQQLSDDTHTHTKKVQCASSIISEFGQKCITDVVTGNKK